MIKTINLLPGVTLRCHTDHRFKQGALSLQLVRPMCAEEAAMNALLPAVWLRGTGKHPDLRAITLHLDDLYGASVSALVRRVGDYQTTGLYCSFMEDRFAMAGDQILGPMIEFLGELLLCPVLEGDALCRDFVEGEKKNLISTIESERNDKRVYASAQLLKTMCKADSFSVPRLGTVERAAAIDGASLYRHHQRIVKESPVELFYVGSREPQEVAALLRPLFEGIERAPLAMPAQMPFGDAGGSQRVEEMEVSQSQLCMGFVTPITNRHADFAAMQVLNTVFGAGMTSKLFMNVREKMSLCYSVGSGYYGTKGIVTVSAGIDAEKESVARQEILRQLDACKAGDITTQELEAAKEAILSGLRGIHDSPGAIESYYSTGALSGMLRPPEEYRKAVEAVTRETAQAAAQTLALHTDYFLKGVGV